MKVYGEKRAFYSLNLENKPKVLSPISDVIDFFLFCNSFCCYVHRTSWTNKKKYSEIRLSHHLSWNNKQKIHVRT